MNKRFWAAAALLVLAAPVFSLPGGDPSQALPQDEARSVAPNVYLDCDRRTCDFNNIKTEITFVNYVLDRQSAEAGLGVNILKGLSFNIGGEYQRVRDQLSLPLADATLEEILLELKRLASGYNLRFEVGFSYRFGSIYSNVVNPRFGNM